LEAFFPFDPYCLNRSSRFLNLSETYITWKEVSSIVSNQNNDQEAMSEEGKMSFVDYYKKHFMQMKK